MSLNHSEHSPEEVESIPDNPVPTFFRWVMPSIGDLLFIMIFLLLLSLGARLLDDGDTGWHIRIGEQIWKTFSIPHQDLYSYTMPDQPWFAWGWLSDVIFAVVHTVLGLNGIVILSALIFSLTFSLLFRFLLKQGTDLILSAILVIIAASASTLHCLARPHIFSLLLTLIWGTTWAAIRFSRFAASRPYARATALNQRASCDIQPRTSSASRADGASRASSSPARRRSSGRRSSPPGVTRRLAARRAGRGSAASPGRSWLSSPNVADLGAAGKGRARGRCPSRRG